MALDHSSFIAVHHKTRCHLQLGVTLNICSMQLQALVTLGPSVKFAAAAQLKSAEEWPYMDLSIVLGTAVWWTDSFDRVRVLRANDLF